MKKPILVLRGNKSVAVLLLSAALLIAGIYIINESKSSDALPVFAQQKQSDEQNRTIADLLGRIMEG